jgi:hypothetical protein
MIAYAAGLLHWIVPLLTAATATILILFARALPSHPAGYQANVSSHPRLPEIPVSEKKKLSETSLVNDGRDC